MSSTLMWRPSEMKGSLPDDLKFALRERNDFEDTLHEVTYTSNDIPFLHGLEIGGVDGAGELIKLIQKHQQIVLDEQN